MHLNLYFVNRPRSPREAGEIVSYMAMSKDDIVIQFQVVRPILQGAGGIIADELRGTETPNSGGGATLRVSSKPRWLAFGLEDTTVTDVEVGKPLPEALAQEAGIRDALTHQRSLTERDLAQRTGAYASAYRQTRAHMRKHRAMLRTGKAKPGANGMYEYWISSV